MARPTPEELHDLITDAGDVTDNWETRAKSVLNIIETYARVYTRGQGFDHLGMPDDNLAAVILSASARLISNTGVDYSFGIDDATSRKASFGGWNLPELAVLHSYRRRTA